MRPSALFFSVLFLSLLVGAAVFGYSRYNPSFSLANVASLLFAFGTNAVSLNDLHTDYSATSTADKPRILIVPGHEPKYGGAQFGSMRERDMVVEVGQYIDHYLQASGNYQVFVTRDTQSWDPTLVNYFLNDWSDILAWEESSKQQAPSLTSLGASAAPPVEHVTDATDVAMRLYGITKWANENHIDVMLHLHFNDYPRNRVGVAGKYSGLVLYTPAGQYANSTTTKAIANAMFRRLSLYNPIDNLPVESSGIIDDPELIAVGANNTADAASMLIEYDFIYEPQFVDSNLRSLALKDLAYQTYLGLQDFFTDNANVSAADSYHPSTLYEWVTPVVGKSSNSEDIYAMQTALLLDGDYPPQGKTMNDCPHSGVFGPCTSAAVAAFQKKNSISGEGPGGPQTFALLSAIYDKN